MNSDHHSVNNMTAWFNYSQNGRKIVDLSARPYKDGQGFDLISLVAGKKVLEFLARGNYLGNNVNYGHVIGEFEFFMHSADLHYHLEETMEAKRRSNVRERRNYDQHQLTLQNIARHENNVGIANQAADLAAQQQRLHDDRAAFIREQETGRAVLDADIARFENEMKQERERFENEMSVREAAHQQKVDEFKTREDEFKTREAAFNQQVREDTYLFVERTRKLDERERQIEAKEEELGIHGTYTSPQGKSTAKSTPR